METTGFPLTGIFIINLGITESHEYKFIYLIPSIIFNLLIFVYIKSGRNVKICKIYQVDQKKKKKWMQFHTYLYWYVAYYTVCAICIVSIPSQQFCTNVTTKGIDQLNKQ